MKSPLAAGVSHAWLHHHLGSRHVDAAEALVVDPAWTARITLAAITSQHSTLNRILRRSLSQIRVITSSRLACLPFRSLSAAKKRMLTRVKTDKIEFEAGKSAAHAVAVL